MAAVVLTRIGRSICAWCQRILKDGDTSLPETHGICASCAAEHNFFQVYSLHDASDALLDRLPFGTIRLDEDGIILAYNQWESELSQQSVGSVLGRSFFTDVAPCTNVESFHGVIKDLQCSGESGTCEFDFVFEFKTGHVLVLIQAVYNAPSNTTLLLVQKS